MFFQLWFGDDQRTLATILIGMSNPMGIVLGSGITPLLVHSKEDVPLMNIVWFIPAGLGSILTMWKARFLIFAIFFTKIILCPFFFLKFSLCRFNATLMIRKIKMLRLDGADNDLK
jgi:hypothetical protein